MCQGHKSSIRGLDSKAMGTERGSLEFFMTSVIIYSFRPSSAEALIAPAHGIGAHKALQPIR